MRDSRLRVGKKPFKTQGFLVCSPLNLYALPLSGPIPSTLGNLRELELLMLFTNELTGTCVGLRFCDSQTDFQE